MPFRKEVAAVDPELAEPEPLVAGGIEHPAGSVEQRNANGIHVAGRVQVPQPGGLPGRRERDPTALGVGRAKRLAGEGDRLAPVLAYARAGCKLCSTRDR